MQPQQSDLLSNAGFLRNLPATIRVLLVLLLLLAASHAATAQSLAVTPGLSALTIHPGDTQVAIPVTVTAPSTYTGAITVTLTGLPSGITVTPAVLTSGGSGTVYLSASVAADQEAFSPLSLPTPGSASSTIQMLAIAGTTQASSPIALTVSLANPAFTPTTLNLPIVRINTSGTAITSKTVNVPGTITITSADGGTSYLPSATNTDNTATFHVHGNSTALMPKLPYNVKMNTSLDLLGAMGLTCPYVTSSGKAICDKSKSYILLANYDDKTMLRDWAASALANSIPYGGNYLSPTPVPSPNTGVIPTPSGTQTLLPWAPHSLFVEVYLNGAYQGTYQLIEEVKVDSHRVNIPELTQSQVSGDLSGGYLLEIDQRLDEDFTFITPQNVSLGLIDPDFTPEVPEQTSYIQNYVDTAEAALFSSSFQDPATGWRAYFDQAAAVNYYIVTDLLGNQDGGEFGSSVYLYKAPDNPFLYMGPVWDFDIGSGNVNYSSIVDPTVPYTTIKAPWYAQWFKDPGFKAAARQQWNALKTNGVLSSWMSSISTEASTLQQAQANNFGRWPMQGIEVWPNAEAAGSYSGEVNYLLAWLTLRMGYMDNFLNGTPATSTALTVSQSAATAGTPITLTAKITGNSPTGAVIFSYNSIVLGQISLNGTGTATLTTSSIPAGSWQVSAAYAGDSNNSFSVSPTAALTVQPALVQTVVNLSSSTSSLQSGSPATLTAVVAGTQGSGTPTGTVTFVANGATVGTAQLASGVAVLTTSSLPAGQLSIEAHYGGDTSYTNAISNSVAITVTSALVQTTTTLTTSATSTTSGSSVTLSATVAGTSGTGTPTGTVTFVANGTTIGTAQLVSGVAVLTTSALPTGQVSVQAQYAGVAPYADSTSSILAITVAPGFVQTVTTLKASGTTAVFGSSVTLSASVAGASGSSTPTGTVTFSANGTALGTIQLASGTAVLTTATLPVGTLTIQAQYSGDTSYAASTSSSVQLQVVGDFSFTAPASATETLSPGSTASLTLLLAALTGSFPGDVTLTLSGVPSTVSCSLSPSTIPATSTAQQVTLTCSEAAQHASVSPQHANGRLLVCGLLLLPLPWFGRRSGRAWVASVLLSVGMSALALGLVGCGSSTNTSSGSTPVSPVNYTVVVTATAGIVQHTTNVTLTVQ